MAQNGNDEMRASMIPPEVALPGLQRVPTQSTGVVSASQDASVNAAANVASQDSNIVMTMPPVEISLMNSTNALMNHIDPPAYLPLTGRLPETRLSLTQHTSVIPEEHQIPEAAPSSLPPTLSPRSNHLPIPDTPDPFVYRRTELNRADQDDHGSDVVPDSQPADSDAVPSSFRTEDAVPSSEN